MLSDQKVIALIEISNSFFDTFFKRMDTVPPAHSKCGIDSGIHKITTCRASGMFAPINGSTSKFNSAGNT